MTDRKGKESDLGPALTGDSIVVELVRRSGNPSLESQVLLSH